MGLNGMTYDPKLSVTAGLDHLATRLDGIIAERLAGDLGTHTWTVILSDLDEMNGRPPRIYSRSDLQTQLKMFTRRLGNFGFPFDDKRRTVSTLASELTIVRNARAHGDDFSYLDAWRAHDYCVRLLEHFVDATGLLKASQLRLEALAAYVEAEGIAPVPVGTPTVNEPEEIPGPEADPEAEDEVVTPDPEVFTLEPTTKTSVVDATRLEFEPWAPVAVGDASVLDDLPKKVAKQKVRTVVIEIVEMEGPIHIDRLAKHLAASFGVQRLHPQREKKILSQIKATELQVDGAKFVWPEGVDPQTWTEFRPNSSDVDRPFEHISPVEIANAMRFLKQHKPSVSKADLSAATLQTFGRKRHTKQQAAHLAKASAALA